uniref:EVE domain-containing protein n=1 Tax=Elaeophora elaphi TaxID=1147741 RepID=A0A0R3RLW3_9BILA
MNLLTYQLTDSFIGYVSRTRVSAVEVWRNDSNDGEVQVAHGINSWPALLEQLSGPILERSTMIEGDVFLYHQRKHHNRAIPLMSAPLKIADRITFKEWLREVAKLRKVTG